MAPAEQELHIHWYPDWRVQSQKSEHISISIQMLFKSGSVSFHNINTLGLA